MTLPVTALIGVAGVLFLLLVVALIGRAARSVSSAAAAPSKTAQASLSKPNEWEASAPSEAIEELVNQALVRAGMGNTRVDFATAHDGSLDIWVGDERYRSVDEIPDARIRQAISEAVAAFNR
ncbi:MAG TPA: hypothetical protein VFI11_15600 [Anaerolineales bacterium]|nr:hypothetical protein [Anaerolineales bacterium]